MARRDRAAVGLEHDVGRHRAVAGADERGAVAVPARVEAPSALVRTSAMPGWPLRSVATPAERTPRPSGRATAAFAYE